MVKSLPDERKALAERYTIDSEEAERREQRAVEQAARRAEAEEVARVEAEEAARQAAAEAARKAAAEEAAKQDAESAALRAAAESARVEAEEAATGTEHSAPISSPTQPQPQLGLAPVFDPPEASEIAEGDEREQTVDLPIYRWFGND